MFSNINILLVNLTILYAHVLFKIFKFTRPCRLQTGHEADHTPSPRGEVRNGFNHTFTPLGIFMVCTEPIFSLLSC